MTIPDQSLHIKLYKANIEKELFIARYVGRINSIVAYSPNYLDVSHIATIEAASEGVNLVDHHNDANSYHG